MFENPKMNLRKLCISCAKIVCCSSESIFAFLHADSCIQNANEQLVSRIHLPFVIFALHINPRTKSNRVCSVDSNISTSVIIQNYILVHKNLFYSPQ